MSHPLRVLLVGAVTLAASLSPLTAITPLLATGCTPAARAEVKTFGDALLPLACKLAALEWSGAGDVCPAAKAIFDGLLSSTPASLTDGAPRPALVRVSAAMPLPACHRIRLAEVMPERFRAVDAETVCWEPLGPTEEIARARIIAAFGAGGLGKAR